MMINSPILYSCLQLITRPSSNKRSPTTHHLPNSNCYSGEAETGGSLLNFTISVMTRDLQSHSSNQIRKKSVADTLKSHGLVVMVGGGKTTVHFCSQLTTRPRICRMAPMKRCTQIQIGARGLVCASQEQEQMGQLIKHKVVTATSSQQNPSENTASQKT